jgi:hypothetical protein
MGGTESGDAASYNYPRFDAYVAAGGDLADETAFWASPSGGQHAEDFTMSRLDEGAEVTLSGLWRSKPVVLKFGSFT